MHHSRPGYAGRLAHAVTQWTGTTKAFIASLVTAATPNLPADCKQVAALFHLVEFCIYRPQAARRLTALAW